MQPAPVFGLPANPIPNRKAAKVVYGGGMIAGGNPGIVGNGRVP